MDSIKEWLDVEEVTRLADALLRAQAPLPATAQAAAPLGGQAKVRKQAGMALAEASERAKRAGIVSENPVPRPRQLPALDTWLSGHSQALGMCVIDRDGDVLHDTMPSISWTNLSVLTAQSGLDELTPAVLRQKVTATDYLQLIAIKTARGSLLVGLLTPVALSAESLVAFQSEVMQLAAEV